MKKIVFFCSLLFVLIFCSGCMQSEDQLVVNEDGSGTLQTHLFIPAGTAELLDKTMGKTTRAIGSMANAFDSEGKIEMKPPSDKSIAEEMFGKEEILKKAKEKNVKIEFLTFTQQKTDKGLKVDYKMKFDNIKQLLESGIVATDISLNKEDSGNWVCLLEEDPQKEQESEQQIAQFENFQDSDEFKDLDPEMQGLILSAMSELELDFRITMPYPIQEVSGAFEKVDERTARLHFSGNLLEDPQAIIEMYGMSGQDSKVVWGRGGAPQMPIPQSPIRLYDMVDGQSRDMPQAAGREMKAAQGEVTVYLKSGDSFTGELMEQDKDHLKLKIFGVANTFYTNEITKIEK